MEIEGIFDDSPGYYDFIYNGLTGNRGGGYFIPRFGIKYHFTKQGEMYYVLFKPDGLMSRYGEYVHEFWWGDYRLVDDISRATIWKSFDEAKEWAKTKGLID